MLFIIAVLKNNDSNISNISGIETETSICLFKQSLFCFYFFLNIGFQDAKVASLTHTPSQAISQEIVAIKNCKIFGVAKKLMSHTFFLTFHMFRIIFF